MLRRTGESQEIAEALSQECGAPAIHDGMWQCFLRKDAPPETKDVIPHDVAKLHCCQKVSPLSFENLLEKNTNLSLNKTVSVSRALRLIVEDYVSIHLTTAGI